jgi:excinuclease UvrABC nuclease subunit
MNKFHHKEFLNTLTTRPGVYQMYGADGDLLYVGKAKNLKSRVGSYFRASGLTEKTMALVARIQDIQVTVTSTEVDALLLEHNLIKTQQPAYNILLRDDKSYPYIFLSSEDRSGARASTLAPIPVPVLCVSQCTFCKRYSRYASARIAILKIVRGPACSIR